MFTNWGISFFGQEAPPPPKPVPLDGSDHARLVNMRIRKELKESQSDFARGMDLRWRAQCITREMNRKGVRHWFVDTTTQETHDKLAHLRALETVKIDGEQLNLFEIEKLWTHGSSKPDGIGHWVDDSKHVIGPSKLSEERRIDMNQLEPRLIEDKMRRELYEQSGKNQEYVAALITASEPGSEIHNLVMGHSHEVTTFDQNSDRLMPEPSCWDQMIAPEALPAVQADSSCSQRNQSQQEDIFGKE